MKRLMNYLLGMVCLTVTGPFPERLINLCAQHRLDFWAVEWLDEHSVRLTTRRGALKELKELAEKVSCTVEVEKSRGLPDFLARFRTRYAFLVGLALTLCAVAFFSRFILVIEVSGNEQVPTAVILSQLRQLGVRPGVYGPALDRQQIAQEALLGLEGLSWMGINLYGTRLEVLVREAVPEPERVDETGYYDIVAEADGIVTHVEAEQGDAVVKEGDTVAVGETLIAGLVTLEPPQYSDLPTRYYETHARGRVWARTWRNLTAAIPLTAQVKTYTGEEKSVWSVNLLGNQVEIFGNSSISWPFYDKITTVRQGRLPTGEALPISLRQEMFREYEVKSISIDLQAAQSLLEDQLLRQLEGLIGEDGEVSATSTRAWVDGTLFKVTLESECLEEIGREVPSQTPMPQQGDSGT